MGSRSEEWGGVRCGGSKVGVGSVWCEESEGRGQKPLPYYFTSTELPVNDIETLVSERKTWTFIFSCVTEAKLKSTEMRVVVTCSQHS